MLGTQTTNPPSEARETQLSTEMKELDMFLQECRKKAEILHSRLSPLLRAATAGESLKDVPLPPLAPLAETIRKFCLEANGVSVTLADILERLEL